MLNLLTNLVVLAAREVAWPRMILAVLGGYVVGGGVGVLLLVDVSDLPDPDAMQAIEERFATELRIAAVDRLPAVPGHRHHGRRRPARARASETASAA